MDRTAPVGSELGGYRIERLLGRGGMGSVYLAEHVRLKRKVALKVLSPELAEDERFRERFIRESELAASLDHPNVLPIYEAGEQDGVLFIAMRYVDGMDLKELLGQQGPLDPDRTAAIVGQLASALDAAHTRGLVHRDIKPGNILIAKTVASTADEHVYLSDFGLTKRASSDSGLTGTGQFVGTLDYAAPEQFEGKPLDARTDVYSLGCLLYECLTGRPPFRRENDAAVMHGHLMEQAPAPSSIRPDLPGGIDPVVDRAMAKKPGDRYESAGAFAADARRELAPADRLGPGGPGRGGGSRVVIVAGAVLGVILGALVVARSLGGEGEAGPTGQTTTGAATTGPSAEGAPPGSVVQIDPSTGVIVSTVTGLDLDLPPGFAPAMAVGAGGVWVLDRSAVTHIDPETRTVTDRVPYPGAGRLGYVRAIDVGDDTVAITDVGAANVPVVGAISAIDPDTDLIRTFELPKVGSPRGVAVGDGAIWETFHCLASVPIQDFFDECPRPQDVLLRIDPETFEVESRYDFGRTLLNRSLEMDVSRSFDTVVAGDDILWVSDPVGSKIWSLDPRTGEVSAPIAVEASDGLAADEASVWVLDRDLGTVTQVDPVEGIGETVRVGSDPTDMTSGLEALWVSDGEGVLWRLDLVTHDVTTIEIGAPLASIAVDEATNSLWLAVFDTQG